MSRQGSIPAYSPRWLYQFFKFVEELPIPIWLLCGIILTTSAIAHHLVAWQLGVIPAGEPNLFLGSLAVFLIVYPAIWPFFIRLSWRALNDFYLESGKSEKYIRKTFIEFVSLPEIPATLVFVLGAVAGFFTYYGLLADAIPLSSQVIPWVSLLTAIVGNAFGAILIYRLLHQIGMMRRLFNEVKADVLHPGPIYALSNYSAASAITVVLTVYGLNLTITPAYLFSPLGYGLQVIITGFALTLFFAPLTQINRRLKRSKQELLGQIGKDLRKLHERLHKEVERRKGIGDLRNQVAALRDELEIVQRLPTWPWRPDAVRGLFSALLLPIVVYLLQRYAGGFFGLQ